MIISATTRGEASFGIRRDEEVSISFFIMDVLLREINPEQPNKQRLLPTEWTGALFFSLTGAAASLYKVIVA